MMSRSHCSICDVTFTSDTHADSHYSGKKHNKKVLYTRQKPPIEVQSQFVNPRVNLFDCYDGAASPLNYLLDDVSPARPNESGHLYFCDICSKNFSGPAPKKQHMESVAHERQMRRAQAVSRSKAHEDLNQDNDRNVPSFASKQHHPVPEDSISQYESRSKATQESTDLNVKSSSQGRDNPIMDVDENCRIGAARLQTSSDIASASPPVDSQGPTHSFKSSWKSFSGDMNMLRHSLIQNCKDRLEEEISWVIPFIAESVVDAVLDAFSEGQNTWEDLDKSHEKTPDTDDTIVPCQQADETPSFIEQNGANTTNTDGKGATSIHTQPIVSSSLDEVISDSQINQDHFDIDGKPASDNSEFLEHQKQILHEHSGGLNNLNGPSVSHHIQGPYQSGTMRNIEGHSNNIVEIYGVQMQTDCRLEMQPTEGVLTGDQETTIVEFTKELFSSVTSQDLIDLEEQFYPVARAPSEKTELDKQVPPSPAHYGNGGKSKSLDEPESTNILERRHVIGCVPEHGLACNLAGNANPVLCTGEQTLENDMLDVVGEIIQELGSQAAETNELHVVHHKGMHGETCN